MKPMKTYCLLGLSLTAFCASAQVHYQRMHSFGFTNLASATPYCTLIQGKDGAIYGTGAWPGPFKFNSDETGFANLHQFNSVSNDAVSYRAGLLQASDGVLYGTSYAGGTDSYGTIFKLSTDGTGYVILHSFRTNGLDGGNSYAVLIEGDDGALYGTTLLGGTNGLGTIFKINKDGSHYLVLHAFGGTPDGQLPQAGLMKASDGMIYGTTGAGGAVSNVSNGTVFKLSQDGSGYGVVHSFGTPISDGVGPQSVLLEAHDGALYGTAYAGGLYGKGTVFKLNKDGTGYTNLHSFSSSGDGVNPHAGLIQDTNNVLYGTTAAGGTNGSNAGTVFMLNADGSGYAIVHSFDYNFWIGREGFLPQGGLLLARNNLLYGTTLYGGGTAGGDPSYGGTIFRVAPDGTSFATLFALSATGGDGMPSTIGEPFNNRGLTEASDRALYGCAGGWLSGANGRGTIFKMNKDGSAYTNIYNFSRLEIDGSNALGVIEASDHLLYGTAQEGGINAGNPGTVFRLNKDGSEYTVLHHFHADTNDGLRPYAVVIEATNGALYGTTYYGGTNGFGTIFRLNKDGSAYGVLHSFGGAGDGQYSRAPLLQASDGMLYGGTDSGSLFKLGLDGSGYVLLGGTGSSVGGLIESSDGALYGNSQGSGAYGRGTVFKLNKDGSGFSVLRSFGANAWDGQTPLGRLAQGLDGALYGVTSSGGTAGSGTAFRLNEDGSGYTILLNFGTNNVDGMKPWAGLAMASDGAFYGVTFRGGDLNDGTLFRFWPPETPDMLAASFSGGSVLVSFSGATNSRYQIFRSTNLANWSLLNTITMPAVGVYTNIDSSPPHVAAFYRAAWLP
jgi:uncharacterized repeat protein (TIGR03803 family)